MPIRKLQGLRGLKGLNTLSPEERDAFMEANASKLDMYHSARNRNQAANILYMNQKYINTFGLDDFNLNNDGTEDAFNMRNKKTEFKLVTDAFKNTFGKDSNFNELATFLDVDGMYDLLNNPDYLTTGELRKKYSTNLDAAKRVGKTYDKAIQNPYVDALGQGFMQIGKQASAQTPLDILNKDKEKNKEILDKLKAESQKRREEEIQGDTDMIYARILEADDSGQQSLAKTLNDFNKVASKASNYYKAFKNSSWLKDYSDEDKLKDYAKYQALKAKYGDTVALSYLERNMQDKVAEAQDGKFTGNTLKGILTTAWSDIGSNVALLANVRNWLNVDRMAIINQGKDPDKPIYDKKGRIVDYKDNINIWTNPAYWNNVYKYNTFSPTEIKAIEERGGVSEDVNVRPYAYTPDFLSWDTAEEGFKQGGHVIASIVETGLTGGVGKAIGFGGKTALKGLGLSAKAIQNASKAGRLLNNALVTATTGLEGSQLEAMGTFDDQLQSAKEKINAEMERELYDYQRSINYNTKDARAAINAYYNQLKAKDNRRVALGNSREGTKAFPLSDATLKAQAKQLYTNALMSNKQKELQELHRNDEMEAARDAAKAYGANFIMDYIKNVPLTAGIQRYKIAKGAMRSTFDNTIKDNIIADAESGGVKRIVNKAGNTIKYTSGKNLAKEIGKQLGAGFADEYLDGINASFASGIGNNEFDNYIRKNYDPKAYDSTVDGMLGNLLAGLSSGIDGLTDRENLYEGFIGMISPLATATVNPNMAFSPKDTWKAIVSGKDAYGEKLGKIDRISSILMNPLLNSISEAREKDKALDRTVDAINKVVAAHKDKINDAAKVISVLNNYDGPIDMRQNAVLDYKDGKLYNAFTLINALNSLEDVDGGTNSQLYKDTMHTIEGLANNTLSQEEMDNEIDMALGDKDNKSILEDKDARAEAASRLQKNAQYFMDMKNRMTEIDKTFAASPNIMKEDVGLLNVLKYNIVASEDYKNRLKSIEDELGIGHTDTESLFTPNYNLRYGTDQAKKRGIAAREREIGKIDKEVAKTKDSMDYVEKKIKVLERQKDNTSDDTKIKDDIQKQKMLLDAYKFQLKSLEESKQKLANEKEKINKFETLKGINTSSFSNEEVLNSDVRDIAYVLDKDNESNFSKGRKEAIDSIKRNLLQKDPEALRKINDAATLATRIEDAKVAYNRILDNKKLATAYLDAADSVRERDAIAESVQRDIKNHYGRIESAYITRNENPEELKSELLSTNSELVNAYMEDHPDQVNDIKPYYDMLKFSDDAVAAIKYSNYTDEEKVSLAKAILREQWESNSLEELKSKLENIIDTTNGNTSFKEHMDTILSTIERQGHSRDATIIENRKQRKEREEADRKKKEEEQKKSNKEAKNAAEKITEVNKAATTNDSSSKSTDEDMGRVPNKKGDSLESSSDVFYLEGTEEPNKENTDVEIKKAAPKSQTVDEEDEHQIPDGQWNAKKLLDDEYKGSSVDMGEMYYGKSDNPKKGNFIVAREEDKISFSIDDNKETLNIAPNEYDVVTDEQENKKNELFIADSLQKIDGNWYFNGTFANDNKQTQVKVSKNFDIDKAIESQQEVRKTALADKDSDVSNPNIIDNGDSIQAQSPSIEQQAKEVSSDGKDIQMSDDNTDIDAINDTGEEEIDNNITTLSGNAMSRYDMSSLTNDGKIVLKKGKDSRKAMDNYYAWMDAAGIKLQNIIDHELARIIKLNPHAKIKFMTVKPEYNATNDIDMKEHLMLVLDYDNSINKGITFIHNDNNGGVIESHGKKYLVVGVAGYGKMNQSKLALYNVLFGKTEKQGRGLITLGKNEYFKKNPNERFYVSDNLATEVVPYSQIPGYIVRQGVNDKGTDFRSVKELLADKDRNPMGYKFDNLAWGIQELSQFMIVGTSLNNVMVPRNVPGNLGSAFVFMPASNGKMVPSYLKVLKYNEMNDGVLKNRINDLLQQVVAPDYKTRKESVISLSNIFYMNKDGDFILLRKNKDEISLTHDGKVEKTFVLDSNFDRGEFLKAIEDMNPRINITARVLSNQELLNEYDEAGALQTDAAMFGTAGSSYSIYALDKDGKMIIPATPVNTAPHTDENSEWRNTNRRQIVFKQRYYTYSPDESNIFYLNGNKVTDDKEINQLKRIRQILDGEFSPATSKDLWDYYVLDSSENPVAVKVNRNTKEVKEASKEQAKELIKKLAEEEAKKQREQAAKDTTKKESKVSIDINDEDTVDIDTGMDIDPNTGEVISIDNQEEPKPKEDTAMFGGYDGEENSSDDLSTTPKSKENSNSGQPFTKVIGNRVYKKRLQILIRKKWEDAPTSPAEMEKFLRDKNIEVDSIGTSKEDIESWIKTIEDCR